MSSIHAAAPDLLDQLQDRVRERFAGDDGERMAAFVLRYFERVPGQVLEERQAADLYGAALAHWQFARRRRRGESLVRVYNPVLEEHGWESPHTVLEVVCDNMPFLVDSVRMEINRNGLQALQVIHPTFQFLRDKDGEIEQLLPRESGEEGSRDALIHLELVRQTDPQTLERLAGDLRRVLADVQIAVHDWRPMREALLAVIDRVGALPRAGADAADIPLVEFLSWMVEDHFTFLGYRRYALESQDGADVLRIVAGSGLGILRDGDAAQESQAFAELPPELRREAHTPQTLLLTKTSARATVHRPVTLDYVGIKRFDAAGKVVGEDRFLGLYGSRAYSCVPQEIPILRQKIEQVMRRADLDPNSHSYKSLQHVLESYPRDELFQIDADELYRIATGILQLDEQQRSRLFVRRDPYGRFMVCLVYVPRERYDTQVRKRMQRILREAFGGDEVEFVVSLTDAPLARILFTVHTRPGAVPEFNVDEIEARLVDAMLSWQDRLHAALLEQLGEEKGSALAARFGEGFPAGYREDFGARTAVHDIEQMVLMDDAHELRMILYRPLEARAEHLRFKVYRYARALPLHKALPMLEHMGVRVEDERPFKVEDAAGNVYWVHDFGLRHPGEDTDLAKIRPLFQEAFARVWDKSLANDRFNALVLKAGLNWRQVSLIRAYAKYLRQTALTFSQPYMEAAVTANPEIAGLLVQLFEARFDPVRPRNAQQLITRLTIRIQEALDAVQSLDHDRILRGFLSVLQATLRTNYYQIETDGAVKRRIAFKLDPSRIPDLPSPRPMFEIFVYSPRVEGVHLRGGKVARGGLRWSDRQEDYRTEVLGLMKAQLVKNAVIVPVGGKGGFVVKQPPATGEREAMRREVEYCYRQFVGGMLDVTDNLVDGEFVAPAELVRYDGDDAYLVVAADKGTATFSDTANEVAAGYGFWLGDAFASGGRAGYDHKKMGITAAGAWECVRQHFRALGIDYDHQTFTVAGIGDMSGDVFGNGLLWSRHIKLVAAFDHRHVFVDPNPDPEASYRERERLFALPASSWADYDPALISAGGGIYPRSLKSVPVSPQAREVLGIQAGSLTPADLIRAILKAPVDLLWNGGIGTYVKAAEERNSDVGDRVNDALRINGRQLRCRVVGEGGNLGLTQRARIEYALLGGNVDTDFIHNAGGVNCSDHEVNIKILLDPVVADGDMTCKQRDALLREMTDEVARLVLDDSYWQACAISLDAARGAAALPEQGRLMRHLEQGGHLDRALEFLPDDKALDKRQAEGRGLTRPELALLVSYAKHTLYEELLESDFPEDSCMLPELERYFPSPLRRQFKERIQRHRLRREILSSNVANRLVNRMGSTFVFRLQEELGVSGAAVARAYAAAWEVFDMRRFWSGAARLPPAVAEAVRIDLLGRAVRLSARTCRRLLQEYGENILVGELIERFRQRVRDFSATLPELLDPGRREAWDADYAELLKAGVAEPLAAAVAGLDVLARALDVAELAESVDAEVETVARVYLVLGHELELDWLADRFSALPIHDRWHAEARSGLRDDLFKQHRALCAGVLIGAMADTSGESKLESWRRRHHLAVERLHAIFYDLKAQEEVDMAMLSVALREVRRLAAAAHPEGSDV